MPRIKEIGIVEILSQLPNITSLDCKRQFSGEEYNVFFCALGFEERCLTIPEHLVNVENFRCEQALYFEYSTNIDDNEVNKARLMRAFKGFANFCSPPLQCDADDFSKSLREFLTKITEYGQKPKVMLDVSVCSSKLILTVLKVLLDFNIYLRILYSEAETYHPTSEEFEREPEKWTSEEGFGIARGVGEVIPNPEYPGTGRENPDLIIVFPTFKPERTRKIIAYIDESLLLRPGNRVIWMIGDPHMEEEIKRKRKDILRRINEISEKVPSYEICTLDYKKTLEILEQIYRDRNLDFHINISALGSKMQSLGLPLFCHARPDVSVYHAIPKEYNPNQYSEGCKATWQIDFGDLEDIRNTLNRVGQLEISNG